MTVVRENQMTCVNLLSARVEVPVIFGARAEVGKASVDCDYAVNCGCSDMGM